MLRNHFETEHNLFRDAFRSFLNKEVVPHQEMGGSRRGGPQCLA